MLVNRLPIVRQVIVSSATLALVCGCTPGSQNDSADAAASTLVRTAVAAIQPVEAPLTIYGIADSEGAATRTLTAPAESVIVSIDAPAGSRVKRGDIVARLRPSQLSQLEAVRARTEAAAAVRTLARMRRLRADGLASDADVETASLAADAANATLATTGQRTAATILRSPIDGYVASITASVGVTVTADSAVATIVPPSATRARFGIDPDEARKIRPGQSISITPASSQVAIAARVTTVDPRVDPATRLASVYANLPSGALVGASEPLIAEITILSSEGQPTIPYSALLDDAGQPYVFVISGDTAHRRNVTVGAVSSERAAITSGLRSGEAVVIDGGTGVADGGKVRRR